MTWIVELIENLLVTSQIHMMGHNGAIDQFLIPITTTRGIWIHPTLEGGHQVLPGIQNYSIDNILSQIVLNFVYIW